MCHDLHTESLGKNRDHVSWDLDVYQLKTFTSPLKKRSWVMTPFLKFSKTVFVLKILVSRGSSNNIISQHLLLRSISSVNSNFILYRN